MQHEAPEFVADPAYIIGDTEIKPNSPFSLALLSFGAAGSRPGLEYPRPCAIAADIYWRLRTGRAVGAAGVPAGGRSEAASGALAYGFDCVGLRLRHRVQPTLSRALDQYYTRHATGRLGAGTRFSVERFVLLRCRNRGWCPAESRAVAGAETAEKSRFYGGI